MKIKIFLLLLFIACMEVLIRERSEVSFLKEELLQSIDFREQSLSPECYQQILQAEKENRTKAEILTQTMLDEKFHPKTLSEDSVDYEKYKKEEYHLFLAAYAAIWQDIRYYPVAGEVKQVEDTWMEERNYEGKRKHEGTDIFGVKDVSGYYPIVSMTDGVVEKIGWLTLGGYRIGIRSISGGYFYYAHLSGYERDFKPGDKVKAGDLLGYMGNTGYGTEGTKGVFPVHLHLGIYIRTKEQEELSVNPYWVLKALEKNKVGNSL